MRTTRAPERLGNSASWNCCEMVQGMRSPVGDPPWLRVVSADWRLISPSMQTWTTQRTSGSADWDSSTGPEEEVAEDYEGIQGSGWWNDMSWIKMACGDWRLVSPSLQPHKSENGMTDKRMEDEISRPQGDLTETEHVCSESSENDLSSRNMMRKRRN